MEECDGTIEGEGEEKEMGDCGQMQMLFVDRAP